MNKYENKMNSLRSRPLRHPVGAATDQVRTIERELDCNLPADYLEFLESYGCHSPDSYTLSPFWSPIREGNGAFWPCSSAPIRKALTTSSRITRPIRDACRASSCL